MQRTWHGAWHINNTWKMLGLQMPYFQEGRVPSCSQSFGTQHLFVDSFILQTSKISGSEWSGIPQAQEAGKPSPAV